MAQDNYDVIIIGGGSAGLIASKFAVGLGKKVALIEKDKPGGVCTWTGCIPSKTLIRVAQIAFGAQNLNKWGLSCKSAVKLDTSSVMDHIRTVRQEVYETHTPERLEQAGITVLQGSPIFKDSFTVELNNKLLCAKKYIIATGTRPFIPHIEGLDKINYLTSDTLFSLKQLPKSLIILGAGPVGVEMASALNRLGIAITLIEMGDRILAKEDVELAHILAQKLITEGVIINTGYKAQKVTQKDRGITVDCINNSNEKIKVKAESILIAVGRRPNTDTLGLDLAGVKKESNGYVVVNDYLQTTCKHIYACGDIVGPYQFSHMAEYQATIATRNACISWFKKKVDYKHVVWVTFTEPELASAGLSEEQARKLYGDTIIIYRKDYRDIDRAKTDGVDCGMAKFICDKNQRLLGAHILGPRAGEIIHEIQVGKYYTIKFTQYYPVIHAYPTYSELLWQTAKRAYITKLKNNKILALLRYIFKV